MDRVDIYVDHVVMSGLCCHVHGSFCHIRGSGYITSMDHVVSSVVDVCRFVQCTHQRMNHITPAEYDEIVNIICSARNAFYMTPGGLVQFNELLQSLRRTKSCKKDLWQRIVNGLASGSV